MFPAASSDMCVYISTKCLLKLPSPSDCRSRTGFHFPPLFRFLAPLKQAVIRLLYIRMLHLVQVKFLSIKDRALLEIRCQLYESETGSNNSNNVVCFGG